MLIELNIEATINKQEILQVMNETLSKIDPSTIHEKWESCTFEGGPPVPAIAVDGSMNNINYVSKVLYATSSHAVNPTTQLRDHSASNNQVELLPNIPDLNKVFSKQMTLMELKTILYSLYYTDDEYVLIDGDIYSMINHINRDVPYFPRKDKFIQEYTQQIVDEEKYNYGTPIPTISSMFELSEEYPADPIQLILYFQMIRELCVLKNILSNYSERIVAVSKTSQITKLYNHDYLSDLALITTYCDGPGYSHELYERNFLLDPHHNLNYPVYDELFKGCGFTNRFVRLTDNGSVLKVQLPGHPSEEKFKQVFEVLSSHALAVTGYPFLLKQVHDEVKISSKNMEQLSRTLGLKYELKERNML